MRLYRLLIQYRLMMTIILAAIGIGLMAFYAVCDTACSYLRGDIFGVDLKYIGVGYMTVIIVLSLLKQADWVRLIVAAGIGVEVFLVSFQVSENVFCPFCLSFGIMIIVMYFINYERSGMMNKWYQKLIYVFGDARIPLISGQRLPLLAMMILGYLFISFSFSGSATPAYAGDQTTIPSYGKGSWELIIFTDYFCPPCQSVEKDFEPELERLLARGDVKITFVDYPGHKGTGLYAKYFLAAVTADKGYKNVLKARKILFSLAEQKKIDQESVLAVSLTTQGIALKIIDPKPVFNQWSALIKQFEITQTPTCLLRFSSAYSRKYSDSEQIRTELIPELQKRFPAGK
ncbi:MAG: thioredoxin domain-containing protein [Deltaproteobacteria bacterium]